MERPKADSFTAFMKAKERLQPAPAPAPAAGARAAATPLSLLFRLAEAREMPLAELQGGSGMAFGEFATALKSLGDSGYITVSGAPGHEVASISKLGEDVARLAHPAK